MKKTVLVLTLLAAAACEKEEIYQETPDSDYIVFGHFYGECVGEQCVEIFRLTHTSLAEDRKDEYPLNHAPYEGKFQLVDQTMFEQVKDLWDEVPAELLTMDETVIGQPDAGDWGGIYFEMNVSGERRYWYIDKMESNLPESLRPFAKTVGDKTLLISN